jgi:hypothetical protein
MAFGQQSGPPASHKQLQYLEALLRKAGHDGFRDARGPLGLTQRQAGGRFTKDEASTLIDQLLAADPEADAPIGAGRATMEHTSAADRLEGERVQALRGMPASLLADELGRRGWSVQAPGEGRATRPGR